MNYLQDLRIQLISIHQTQKFPIPESLEILRSVVSSTFLDLPQQWDLSYINSDNQEITVHSEQDFHDLLASALRASSKIIAILIKERKNISEPIQDPEHQVIDEKSEVSAESLIDTFQHIAKLRRLFEVNKTSQLSKDSFISVISELVMTQNLNLRQQQQEPKEKASEGHVASLLIGEKTLEDLFQKMINKNIHNIASMTAKILQNKEGQPQVPVLHEDARCHECGASPFLGIRFKCAVCPDYDLCELCESAHDHVHALVKIKHSGQQYKPLQEEQGGYSKLISLVQSENFEVPARQEEKPDGEEEEKSSSVSHQVGGVKKSGRFAHEPEALGVIQEEPKVEDKQLFTEEEEKEEKIDLGAEENEEESGVEDKQVSIEEKEKEDDNVEKEEEPLEIKQEELLISADMREVYSALVIEKAKQLHQLLSGASLEKLLEFVNNSPSDVDIVELMERFQVL